MRIVLILISLFSLGFFSLSVMVSKATLQEEYLVGTWVETQWHYDKDEDRLTDRDRKLDTVAGEGYRIHQAESWVFMNDGKLKLVCSNEDVMAKWSIKGRGNILQIKYADDYTESYQFTGLNNETMVLNYESDAQAKGIAELIFKKKEDNDAKKI